MVRSRSGFSSAGSPPPWPYAGGRQRKNGEGFLSFISSLSLLPSACRKRLCRKPEQLASRCGGRMPIARREPPAVDHPPIYHSRATGDFSLPVTVGNVTAESPFRPRCAPLRRPENLYGVFLSSPYVWPVGFRRSFLSRSNLSFPRIYEVHQILSSPLHRLQRRHTRKKGGACSVRVGNASARPCGANLQAAGDRRTVCDGCRCG